MTQGSAEVIRELLELHFVLTHVNIPWNKWKAFQSVPADTTADAAAQARDIVDQLSATGEGGFTRTDSAVLDALSTVLSYVGDGRTENFFINESWTADSDVVKYTPPAVPHAIVVAATGNDGNSVLTDRVDFAQRALTNAYVVAVMNLRADGTLDCCSVDTVGAPTLCSGRVAPEALADFAGVGFDGRTTNTCGTSIASPRVGWLLAAAESARTIDPASEVWVVQLRAALKDSRLAGGGYKAVALSVRRLFTIWLGPPN